MKALNFFMFVAGLFFIVFGLNFLVIDNNTNFGWVVFLCFIRILMPVICFGVSCICFSMAFNDGDVDGDGVEYW